MFLFQIIYCYELCFHLYKFVLARSRVGSYMYKIVTLCIKMCNTCHACKVYNKFTTCVKINKIKMSKREYFTVTVWFLAAAEFEKNHFLCVSKCTIGKSYCLVTLKAQLQHSQLSTKNRFQEVLQFC